MTLSHFSSRVVQAAPATRRHLLGLCLGAAFLGAGCADAQAEGRWLQVDVVDRETGQVLQVFRDHGQPVVAGSPGSRYALRVTNRSGERLLAVVAIDGVNIVSGETANFQQTGYVLGPWQSADLTGWRKSDDEVAAFEFTRLPDSYAARTGRPLDVGVIGVAVFRERPAPVVQRTLEPPVSATPSGRMDSSATGAAPMAAPRPAPMAESRELASADRAAAAKAAAPQPSERLGTGHGERESSSVAHTDFERASRHPQETLRIRYDSYANLVAAGIAPQNWARVNPQARPPRAFPGEPGAGYVPDPPSR